MKKILVGMFWVWLVIAAAIVAAGIIVFFQTQPKPISQSTPTPKLKPIPTPQAATVAPEKETANWKAYRNKNLGFSVKYPPDWEISESAKEKPQYLLFWNDKTLISIFVIDKSLTQNLPCGIAGKISEISIDGVTTKMCTTKLPGGATAVITVQDFTKDGETWYEIIFSDPIPDEKNPEKVKVFNLMLLTFRFE